MGAKEEWIRWSSHLACALFNQDVCKWVLAAGPEFICVSSVLKLVISGTRTHTRTCTHIDESCLQANWNLGVDYSSLVDDPGESSNYEFQTSWPKSMMCKMHLLYFFLEVKMLLTLPLYMYYIKNIITWLGCVMHRSRRRKHALFLHAG